MAPPPRTPLGTSWPALAWASHASPPPQTICELLAADRVLELLLPYTDHKNFKVRGKAGAALAVVVGRLQVSMTSGSVRVRALCAALHWRWRM